MDHVMILSRPGAAMTIHEPINESCLLKNAKKDTEPRQPKLILIHINGFFLVMLGHDLIVK